MTYQIKLTTEHKTVRFLATDGEFYAQVHLGPGTGKNVKEWKTHEGASNFKSAKLGSLDRYEIVESRT